MVAFTTIALVFGVTGLIGACGFVIASLVWRDIESDRIENEATALEIKKENDAYIMSMCDAGKLSPDHCADALGTSQESFDETASIFDKIGDVLGVNSKTALWILLGVVAFSMLKG